MKKILIVCIVTSVGAVSQAQTSTSTITVPVDASKTVYFQTEIGVTNRHTTIAIPIVGDGMEAFKRLDEAMRKDEREYGQTLAKLGVNSYATPCPPSPPPPPPPPPVILPPPPCAPPPGAVMTTLSVTWTGSCISTTLYGRRCTFVMTAPSLAFVHRPAQLSGWLYYDAGGTLWFLEQHHSVYFRH